MRQRICLVVGQLAIGGLERQACLLAMGLAQRRYDVTVVSMRHGGPWADTLRESGINVVVVGRRGHLDWRRLLGLYRALRALRPGVVYSFNYEGNAYARLAGLLAGVPVLITGERSVYMSRWMVYLERVLIRFTECVICNAEAIRRDLVGRAGLPEAKVVTIPNAVVVPPAAGLEERLAARGLVGASEDDIVVGTIARLAAIKNIPMLVEAAALCRSDRRLRFCIVGGGPEEAAVREAMRKHGMEDRFTLLGEREDARTLLPGFDLFVLSSWSEGLPNTVMEAMAAGLPCVCTDVGGCRELVQENVTGHLVAPGDAAAMATRILSLAGRSDLRAALGRAGRDRITDGFSVERMVDRVEDILVRLMGAASSSPRGTRLQASLDGAR